MLSAHGESSISIASPSAANPFKKALVASNVPFVVSGFGFRVIVPLK